MAISKFKEVPLAKLRWQCDPDSLGFSSTEEIKSSEEIIGQERALRAMKLGLAVDSRGYNIFVSGLTGTGKTTTVKQILEQIDTTGEIPDDICYVHNFDNPDFPKVLRLPPGSGRKFSKDMDAMIADLRIKLPQILESEEFKNRSKSVLERFEKQSKLLYQELEKKIKKEGFAVVQVQMGMFSRPEIFPVLNDKVVPWDQFSAMVEKGEIDQKDFNKLRESHAMLTDELEETLRTGRKIERSIQEALQKLKLEFCLPAVQGLVTDLSEKYENEAVSAYLTQTKDNLLSNLERFTEKKSDDDKPIIPGLPVPQEDEFLEFKINVIVDNSSLKRVPVIIETAPNYRNLFGTIERVVDRYGGWHSDFTRIKAGSMLRANGGYLVLNMLDTLGEPGVWSALKRTLKNSKLDIQAYDPFSIYSTSGLKPEAIDVDLKIVIIGDPHLYRMAYFYDDDFKKIFKVKADFDTVMPRTRSSISNYAGFIRMICEKDKLAPFTKSGVARVVEFGVRLAGRQNKISTRFSDIADLVREANYWASENDSKMVDGEQVMRAIEEKAYRSGMIEDKIQELIREGILMIDIAGQRVGQVNGLSVYNLGDYSFGRPSKITAEVSVGRSGIINIEREADLSGKTHNKGVLIIGGYLRGKYAQNRALSMSASIAFEQSYSGIDGDSASAAEVFVILSELANLPLRQDVAITGSINQKGEIQPIGGVNQKIEGFYEVCKIKGLTGEQGVIIPHQNIGDLMLKPDLVLAIKAGKFHIYSIKTLDEGIEILSGVKAGRLNKKNEYTRESVNYLIDKRLLELSKAIKATPQTRNKNSGKDD